MFFWIINVIRSDGNDNYSGEIGVLQGLISFRLGIGLTLLKLLVQCIALKEREFGSMK